ncbi:biosynthetic-type acetolactate synthase large subunit [Fulvivirga ligni]|uniref:biosynthetic-type acetolactate synthase large subunit n=1 Tax=Fulvivirga ligni TaxID=2904246 RepID=UPI001F18712D|nr:biosynthetic-type acetolactate synthase large subunit [Fulvivirga ligni]UII23359.1 biosynthetic-type acetolactate synthase large subunit [Fulvivirga ligni]
MDTLTKTVGEKQIEKQSMAGSEAVIRSLLAEGVETVFGYPGGAIMPVYDSLWHFQEELKHILTRHEQGAIHAAQGMARVTNKPGVVFATSGPGATNLITGLADAKIDSTPLVCITGQVASPLLGTDAFQETDIISISMPVTKWNTQVTKAEDIPSAIAKAFYIATSGRPGPVLIDITKDAQFASLDFSYKKCNGFRSYVPKPALDHDEVEKAARLIDSAKKPFILFGQGIILSEAENELKAFVEKTGIPAAWTVLGLSAMPTDHPLNVGMLGMHGNYAPNKLTNECDVLIAVGMRFDDRVTGDLSRYAKQAKVVHLEIDPAEIDKNVKTDIAILGDAKESLQLLTSLCSENNHDDWVQKFHDLKAIEYDQVIQKELNPDKPGLTMGEVIRRVNGLTDSEAVVVTDVGQHQMVACRYATFKQTKSNVTSGGLGTMGFCLPAALGAKLGAPERAVVAVIGDGGFQMTLQELGTIFQTNAAVKIIILNNNFLGMVRQWQQLFFDKRYSSTELVNPDFVTISKGFGIEASSVSERQYLDAALKTMMDHDGPYLLEVMVEKEDNVFPMVPTGASVEDVRLS